LRFALSMFEQLKQIWRPYLYGMLGAVTLAFIVAAVGGLFVDAMVGQPARSSEYVVATITVITAVALGVLARSSIVSTLSNMLHYFVRHRGHD
jgi:hypothetical protein